MMKKNKIYFLLLLIVLISCGKKEDKVDSDTPPPADKEEEVNIHQAIFTDPAKVYNKEASVNMLDSLIHYIKYTREGETIYINVFLFNYPALSTAIKAAYVRGVEMHVIIDSSRDDSRNSNKDAIEFFQSTFQAPSEIIATDNQINPTWAINHSKYALFSKVNLPNGIAKNLVFATSHNFTLGQAKMIQDAVIMTNEDLYDTFVDNWKAVATNAKDMINFNFMHHAISDSIHAFFFPKIVNGQWDGTDPVIDQLEAIDVDKKDTIRIFFSPTWSGARGVNIAKKLTDLKKDGVDVEVMTTTGISQDVESQLNVLRGTGAFVRILDGSHGQIHSKVMLIKGIIDGTPTKLIMMGSENYGEGALKYNNNFMLQLKNSSLFEDYWDYYKKIKQTLTF